MFLFTKANTSYNVNEDIFNLIESFRTISFCFALEYILKKDRQNVDIHIYVHYVYYVI